MVNPVPKWRYVGAVQGKVVGGEEAYRQSSRSLLDVPRNSDQNIRAHYSLRTEWFRERGLRSSVECRSYSWNHHIERR